MGRISGKERKTGHYTLHFFLIQEQHGESHWEWNFYAQMHKSELKNGRTEGQVY